MLPDFDDVEIHETTGGATTSFPRPFRHFARRGVHGERGIDAGDGGRGGGGFRRCFRDGRISLKVLFRVGYLVVPQQVTSEAPRRQYAGLNVFLRTAPSSEIATTSRDVGTYTVDLRSRQHAMGEV